MAPNKTFAKALQDSDFALSAELPMTPDTDRKTIIRQCEQLRSFVDALNVPDNRFGHVHMSPLAVASILLQHGVDPVMELSCRNRNQIALLSDLLGARELGVTSLQLIRGKKAPDEFKAQKQFLIDTQVSDLIAMASNVYRDEARSEGIHFLLGTGATVHDPEMGKSTDKLNKKIDAGAQVLQSQLCLDIDLLRRYVKHLIDNKVTRRAFLVITTAPLLSFEAARQMRERQSHLIISDTLLRRLKSAANPEEAGIDACAEFLQELKEIPGVNGAVLQGTDNTDVTLEVLKRAGIDK